MAGSRGYFVLENYDNIYGVGKIRATWLNWNTICDVKLTLEKYLYLVMKSRYQNKDSMILRIQKHLFDKYICVCAFICKQ